MRRAIPKAKSSFCRSENRLRSSMNCTMRDRIDGVQKQSDAVSNLELRNKFKFNQHYFNIKKHCTLACANMPILNSLILGPSSRIKKKYIFHNIYLIKLHITITYKYSLSFEYIAVSRCFLSGNILWSTLIFDMKRSQQAWIRSNSVFVFSCTSRNAEN